MKMKVAVMKCRAAVRCDRTGVITILHGDVTPGHTVLSVRLLMIMVALARGHDTANEPQVVTVGMSDSRTKHNLT